MVGMFDQDRRAKGVTSNSVDMNIGNEFYFSKSSPDWLRKKAPPCIRQVRLRHSFLLMLPLRTCFNRFRDPLVVFVRDTFHTLVWDQGIGDRGCVQH